MDIPAFLRRTTPSRPFREPRWKKLKPRRPEADRWAEAERWECTFDDRCAPIASGRRRVWVVEGRKWVRLHDGQSQAKIAMSLWRQIQRHGTLVA